MTRFGFVVRRLLQTIPLLLGITLLVFLLLQITPGDTARAVAGPRATPAAVAEVRRELGLDQPVPVQYLRYIERTVQGDLGDSTRTRVPVTEIISEALPVTLWLIVSGVILALAVAIPSGAIAAVRRERLADHAVRSFTLIGIGMPIYWVGIMLVIVIALPTGLFPVGGFGDSVFDRLHSIVLPAVAFAIATAPVLVRSLRSSVISVMDSDYVSAVRSVGMSGTRLLRRHVLRNSIVPTIALLATQIGYFLFAAVVLENAFSLPGLGQAMVVAAGARDFPVVLGITLVFALIVVVVHLVADIAIALLDPRIRVG